MASPGKFGGASPRRRGLSAAAGRRPRSGHRGMRPSDDQGHRTSPRRRGPDQSMGGRSRLPRARPGWRGQVARPPVGGGSLRSDRARCRGSARWGRCASNPAVCGGGLRDPIRRSVPLRHGPVVLDEPLREPGQGPTVPPPAAGEFGTPFFEPIRAWLRNPPLPGLQTASSPRRARRSMVDEGRPSESGGSWSGSPRQRRDGARSANVSGGRSALSTTSTGRRGVPGGVRGTNSR